MNVNITIIPYKLSLLVLDNTKYLDEDSPNIAKLEYKQSEVWLVDIVHYNTIKEEIKDKIYFHKGELKYLIPIKYDGHFTILHLIIPSKEWFNSRISKLGGLEEYSIVYYTDGEHIYKYTNEGSETVPTNEFIIANVETLNSTAIERNLEHVSIYNLLQCYINLCLLIFDIRGFSPCWNKNSINSELIYKRDLVWMAINVIKYLKDIDLGSALRVIEQIHGCNGICKNNVESSKTVGCGCSKGIIE